MHKYLTVQNTECKRGGSELVDTPQSLYSTAFANTAPGGREEILVNCQEPEQFKTQ